MNIKYVEGDMFGPLQAATGPVYLPHVCNDKGAWGAGFVVPLGRTFPPAKEAYTEWSKMGQREAATSLYGPFVLGQTQFIMVRSDPAIVVVNMVAQTLGGARPIFYNHLVTCMEVVAQRILQRNQSQEEKVAIMCPMFGAGLAGGDWNFIEQLIIDCWIKRKIPVTVFYLPGMLPSNWTLPTE